MTDIKFPVGSIVVLKSGGPRMTITSYQNGFPLCEYFVNGELKRFPTRKENLQLVVDDDDEH